MDELREVHQLYCRAYEVCQRARDEGKEYIGFQRAKDGGFKLIASRSNYGGRSSARMGLSVADWASNVLYRLREEAFIDDLPIDAYFEYLTAVGRQDATET